MARTPFEFLNDEFGLDFGPTGHEFNQVREKLAVGVGEFAEIAQFGVELGQDVAGEAGHRAQGAGVAIRESVEAFWTALAGGPGDQSKFVPTSQTFGIFEAIDILVYGEVRPTVGRGVGSIEFREEGPRRLRSEIKPLFDIELTERQEEMALGVGIIIVGTLIATGVILPGALGATAPLWVPALIVALFGALILFAMYQAFGDDLKAFFKWLDDLLNSPGTGKAPSGRDPAIPTAGR